MEITLFYVFKALTIFSAICVVNARNPVHAVLLLILVFANVAGILILLGAEFLALVFLVVYVGAIAVLFLFVVMMLNVKLTETSMSELNYLPLNIVITLIVGSIIAYLTYLTFHPSNLKGRFNSFVFPTHVDAIANMTTIGHALFKDYFFPFLLTGVILLVAMIGSIMLTLTHQSGTRRQEIYAQNSREILGSLVKHV